MHSEVSQSLFSQSMFIYHCARWNDSCADHVVIYSIIIITNLMVNLQLLHT